MRIKVRWFVTNQGDMFVFDHGHGEAYAFNFNATCFVDGIPALPKVEKVSHDLFPGRLQRSGSTLPVLTIRTVDGNIVEGLTERSDMRRNTRGPTWLAINTEPEHLNYAVAFGGDSHGAWATELPGRAAGSIKRVDYDETGVIIVYNSRVSALTLPFTWLVNYETGEVLKYWDHSA